MSTLQSPQIPLDLQHQLTTAISDMTEPERQNALQLIEILLNSEKRRSHRKFRYIQATVLCDKVAESAIIENLSPGGAFLSSCPLYPPGSEITLTFSILNFEFPVKLKAEIIWVSPKGMGLKFKTSQKLDHRLAFQKLADALVLHPSEY